MGPEFSTIFPQSFPQWTIACPAPGRASSTRFVHGCNGVLAWREVRVWHSWDDVSQRAPVRRGPRLVAGHLQEHAVPTVVRRSRSPLVRVVLAVMAMLRCASAWHEITSFLGSIIPALRWTVKLGGPINGTPGSQAFKNVATNDPAPGHSDTHDMQQGPGALCATSAPRGPIGQKGEEEAQRRAYKIMRDEAHWYGRKVYGYVD